MGKSDTLALYLSQKACPTTMPDFLLTRTKAILAAGKSFWITDAVTGESHSYEDFERDTRNIASFLFKQGMRRGDTLIFMTNDVIKSQIIFTGVWRANGVVRCSPPEDDDAEMLLHRVEESRAGWIICDSSAVARCKSVTEKVYWEIQVIICGRKEDAEADGCLWLESLFGDDGTECPEPELKGESPALILCTRGSGRRTLGQRKQVVHTHHALLHSLASAVKVLPLSPNSPNLFVTHGTHVTGAIFPFSAFTTGRHCLVMSATGGGGLLEAIHSYRPGFLWCTPTLLHQLVQDARQSKYSLSSVTTVTCSGAGLSSQVLLTLPLRLPNLISFINIYDLTEALCVCAMPHTLETMGGLGATFLVGEACPGVTIKIRDTASGKILDKNAWGEILVKCNWSFKQYLKDPESTVDAFLDGCFKTGDLGYMDDNSRLHLMCRVEEAFKCRDQYISPNELELAILQHKAVSQACVYGVDDPDDIVGGKIPRAVITLRDGYASPQEILDYANARLPDHKKIRGGLYIAAQIPKDLRWRTNITGDQFPM